MPQDARVAAVDLNGDASFTFLVLQRVTAGNWISRCYTPASLFTVGLWVIRRIRFGGFEDICERNEIRVCTYRRLIRAPLLFFFFFYATTISLSSSLSLFLFSDVRTT